jgi:hypothetical protein
MDVFLLMVAIVSTPTPHEISGRFNFWVDLQRDFSNYLTRVAKLSVQIENVVRLF